jgi:hypothetical protein
MIGRVIEGEFVARITTPIVTKYKRLWNVTT